MAQNSLPVLRDPIVVAAFEGWNDAGDAASAALEHLDTTWQATPLMTIDDEDYYDYQVNRPWSTASLASWSGLACTSPTAHPPARSAMWS